MVGTPKAQLKGFEQELLEEENWHQVQPGVEAKLVGHPDGDITEQFILSQQRPPAEGGSHARPAA